MITLDFLKEICPTDREILKRPFLIDVGGTILTAASDGHILVAVEGNLGFGPPEKEGLVDGPQKWLVPGEMVTMDTAPIRAWCGAFQKPAPRKCVCHECDNEHTYIAKPDARPGRIGDAFFVSRNLVARVLEAVDDTAVSVQIPKTPHDGPLLILGNGWRSGIMGMAFDPDKHDISNYPPLDISAMTRQLERENNLPSGSLDR